MNLDELLGEYHWPNLNKILDRYFRNETELFKINKFKNLSIFYSTTTIIKNSYWDSLDESDQKYFKAFTKEEVEELFLKELSEAHKSLVQAIENEVRYLDENDKFNKDGILEFEKNLNIRKFSIILNLNLLEEDLQNIYKYRSDLIRERNLVK